MLYHYAHRQFNITTRLSVGACLALLFILYFFPVSASAHATNTLADGPSLRVNVGFDGRYRDGNWIPVQVTLRNDTTNDFNGVISIDVPNPFRDSNNPTPLATYHQPISLPSGTPKQVTLYVPFSTGGPGVQQNITVNLLNAGGQKVSSQTSALRPLNNNDIFVGVLSNQPTGFGPLNAVALPDPTASVVVQPLNATTMPTLTEALQNFDLLVVDNFTTSALSKEQLTALQSWVRRGGTLVAVGGPEWHRTLAPLPSELLPVTLKGITNLPASTPLLPIGGPTKGDLPDKQHTDTVQAPVTVSSATPQPGSTVIHSASSTPLLVQAPSGQGMVYYLAYDPTLDPIAGWSSTPNLWKGLLLRTVDDQVVATNQNPSGNMMSNGETNGISMLLRALLPNSIPSTWLILGLLLGYVTILGPVRLLIVKYFKKRNWSWRIALSTIVIFSLLSYGLALQQKGTTVVSSSLSTLQLSRHTEAGTMAHVTTYLGVFVPNQGDFQVHMPGSQLVQTVNSQYPREAQSTQATITSQPGATDVKLQGVDIWTLRSLMSSHERQFKGGLVSHLTLQNGSLVGSVTNTLPYSLSDVHVLMGKNFVSLGSLSSGQTQQVNLSLKISDSNSSQDSSLASLIAVSHGQPVSYDPYYNTTHTLNQLQRRMAQLATFSGLNNAVYCNSGSCSRFATRPFLGTTSGITTAMLSGGGGPQIGIDTNNDPLLMPGAAATLIGWTDHIQGVSDNITINGAPQAGVQDTFVQAPLDVSYGSGPVVMTSNLISRHLVNVESQGTNLQSQLPGIYTMSNSSMTFEFMIPVTPKLHVSSLTITEKNNLSQMMPSQNSAVDASHLNVVVYNWRSHSWDSFTLNQLALAIKDAQPYIDSNGRVLVQFANQHGSQDMVLFNRPTLELHGTISQ